MFDRYSNFNRLQHLKDTTNRLDPKANSYPPYNTEQVGKFGDRITIAVTGFRENDLDSNVKENTLVIFGKLAGPEDCIKFVHCGVVSCTFRCRFVLADHITANGSNLGSGPLHAEPEQQIPEGKKVRKIAISQKAIENEKAN